jgi:hypothetical protein
VLVEAKESQVINQPKNLEAKCVKAVVLKHPEIVSIDLEDFLNLLFVESQSDHLEMPDFS